MIKYKTVNTFTIAVKLEARVVGHIRRSAAGWSYQPKNSTIKTEPSHSLEHVKRQLERD